MNLQQPQQMSLPAMSLPPMCMARVSPPSMNANTFTLPAHNYTVRVQTSNLTLQMLFNTISQMKKKDLITLIC